MVGETSGQIKQDFFSFVLHKKSCFILTFQLTIVKLLQRIHYHVNYCGFSVSVFSNNSIDII